MGQTSSQLLAPTQHAEDTRTPRGKMQDSRAGSPLGSEINVSNPRSKLVLGLSPLKSPKTTQKRKHDEQVVPSEDVPKKKKRKVKKGSGRPRDPSLLKKSVVVTEGLEQSIDGEFGEERDVEQVTAALNVEGANLGNVNMDEELPVEDAAVKPTVQPKVVEGEQHSKKVKTKRKENDTGPPQTVHQDGRKISPSGQRGPRSRRKTKADPSSRPQGSEGHQPGGDATLKFSNQHTTSDCKQPNDPRDDPDAQRALPDSQSAIDLPVDHRDVTGLQEEDLATAEEVLAEMSLLMKELQHLTRKKIPDKHARLSLMRRSLTCIGDYLYTWLPEGDPVVDQIWDRIAQTAWPRHTRPETTGASLLRVYREQTKDDRGRQVRRRLKGEGDRCADLIRKAIKTPMPHNESPALPSQAVAPLLPESGATNAHAAEPGPELTPPESHHEDNTLREPSGSFNEGIHGVAGWVEAHNEGAADPNIASPRRERAQKTILSDNRPAVQDLNIGRALPVTLPDPLENGPSSGLFTTAEKAAADDVFDHVCQRNNFDAFEFRASTIDWRNVAPELKAELAAALPKRNMRAIRKFAMRRYRPKKDGSFDKDEDERLTNAVAEYGEHWQDVADVVGERTADQCRDRYRLILKYGDDRTVGPWSREEEASLVKAVHEVMEQIKEANVDKGDLVNDDSEVQRMIRWETVADKMGGKRSRKRCSEKWTQLVARNMGRIPALQAATAVTQVPCALYDVYSKKQRGVSKKYDMFAIGDVYDVLEEIHTALGDHNKGYSHESTVWAIVTGQNPESRFTGPLRRKAFHEALEMYGEKGKVSKQTTIAGKAAAMVAWLDGYAKRKKIEEFERTYLPEKRKPKANSKAKPAVTAASQPASPVARRASVPVKPPPSARSKTTPGSNSKKRTQFLSAERVEDSDAEDEDMIDAKPALLDNPDDDYVENEGTGNDNGDDMKNRNDEAEDQQIPASDPPTYEDAKMPVITEMQQDQALAGAQATTRAVDDAMTVSSLNSRYNRRVARPSLGTDEFIARCRRAGRRQHEEYMGI